MFGRYTEKARQTIFFARYEASQFSSPYIESEHILLGLLRTEKALSNRFLRSEGAVESIRKQIEAHSMPGERVPSSVDLPLSNESKRVLAYAAEEAERLKHHHIGNEHLLLGLLREETCFAAAIARTRTAVGSCQRGVGDRSTFCCPCDPAAEYRPGPGYNFRTPGRRNRDRWRLLWQHSGPIAAARGREKPFGSR